MATQQHETSSGKPLSSEVISPDPKGLARVLPPSADAVPAIGVAAALRLEKERARFQEHRCRVGPACLTRATLGPQRICRTRKSARA